MKRNAVLKKSYKVFHFSPYKCYMYALGSAVYSITYLALFL